MVYQLFNDNYLQKNLPVRGIFVKGRPPTI